MVEGSINRSQGRKNSAESLLLLQHSRRMRRTNFTEYLELMQNCDLWETLGQIKFSSGENMNKVTAQDHEMKIY